MGVIQPEAKDVTAYGAAGRTAVEGSRFTPDGAQLRWRQVGVKGLQSDPQLPFFVQWLSDRGQHPSTGGGTVALSRLEIAGDHDRVDEWLGEKSNLVLDDLDIEWVAPHGQPGIVAAVFTTPSGVVRI